MEACLFVPSLSLLLQVLSQTIVSFFSSDSCSLTRKQREVKDEVFSSPPFPVSVCCTIIDRCLARTRVATLRVHGESDEYSICVKGEGKKNSIRRLSNVRQAAATWPTSCNILTRFSVCVCLRGWGSRSQKNTPQQTEGAHFDSFSQRPTNNGIPTKKKVYPDFSPSQSILLSSPCGVADETKETAR